MKIFVTGGTGFFGRSLLRHWSALAASGSPTPLVTIMSRSPDAFLAAYPEFEREPWLRMMRGDVLDFASFPSDRFDRIIHAATESTVGLSLPPAERFEQIVAGTRAALQFARACGARRFLLTSSGGVYGRQPANMESLPETYLGAPDSLEPNSAYGIGKRVAEHLCGLEAGETALEVVVARCFAFVGPDLPLNVHFAIGNFLRDAIAGNAVRVSGDGRPMRSYLHQDDLAEWLCELLERGVSGEAYNVGSDEAFSIREIAEIVRDIVAPTLPLEVALPPGTEPPHRYIPDIAKARALGLTVRLNLHDAIRSTYRQLLARGIGI